LTYHQNHENKLVITKWKQGVLTALLTNGEPVEFHYEESDDTASILPGNIYIGRIKDIVSNINAAFVEIAPAIVCYLSLEDAKAPIFINEKKNNKLVQNDEILVQITKEQAKSKLATVTTNLSFAGKYAVLTTGNKKFGISSKIDDVLSKTYHKIITPYLPKGFGVIIRTNAQYVSTEIIIEEISRLETKCNHLIALAKHRTCYTLMHSTSASYLFYIRDTNMEKLSSIITDDMEIYNLIQSYLEEQQNEDLMKLKYYEDELLPLIKLYSLESKLEHALQKRVWLKSGGYLVIESTEALVVIDVNTGKYVGKKGAEETFLKINLEASLEIVKQLRLRNLSGIIIIDFINMADDFSRKQLLDALTLYAKEDTVKINVIDMTGLNLVELTRRKVRKPLHEQIKFHLTNME